VTLEVRLARPEDLPAMHALRHQVFVVEQGVPESLERDERDAAASHAVALREGRVVGCGRLIERPGGTGTVGRMAVLGAERGQGVGTLVLRRLEEQAIGLGTAAIELHAQVHARRFYERAGYAAVGGVYLEAGLEHVTMRRPLPVVREVRDDDADELVALIGGCWAAYPGVELHVDAEEPWLRAPATAYAGWDGRMWVVELAGALVACCGVKPVRDGVVELKSMYVAAAARRQGLARRLEALVREQARRRDAHRVELWSDTRFSEAHATYTALGYEQLPGERNLHDLSHSFEYPFAKQLVTRQRSDSS